MEVLQFLKVTVFCLFMICYGLLVAILSIFIPKRKKDLTGKTVLITGAGSGIGRQLAIEFSKHSTTLVLLDLNLKGLDETKKLLEIKTKSFLYECDVSDRKRVYQLAETVKREVGNVDILVNNAGIVSGGRLLDIPDEKIVKTFEVNILAHFWACKAFLPEMIARNSGHIVSVASLGGLVGAPNLTDYVASKFSVVGLMESLNLELQREKLDGIKVTTVCPGFVSTGLFEGMTPIFDIKLTPEQVAKAVVTSIRKEQEVLLIPSWSSFPLALNRMIPQEALKQATKLSGILHVMDEFKGRTFNQIDKKSN